MPHGYIVIGAVIALQRILPDKESDVAAIRFIERQVGLFADRDMAAVAAGVADAVADLAGRAYLYAARVEGRNPCSHPPRDGSSHILDLRSIVAVCRLIRRCGVHIGGIVTGYAVHALFAEMNVARQLFILAQVFIPYSAAVTGRAGAGHRRGFLKGVPGQKAPTHTVRLADVALPAGRVARRAVVIVHRFQDRMRLRGAACVQRRPIAAQGIVQTGLISGCNFAVTG